MLASKETLQIKPFDAFQLEEYKNISNAHFETNKQIGVFYRYFLIVTSAPTLIFVWFGKEQQFIENIFSKPDLFNNTFIGLLLIVVSIIGFLSTIFLINLNLDSILYARTVNGVRNYFYNNSKSVEKYRVLPIEIATPKYFNFLTFGPIVSAFALINSVYMAIGTSIVATIGNVLFDETILINNYGFRSAIIVSGIYFLLHFLVFLWLSTKKK